MDKITQRLFGIAAVIFALAFFVQTISPAVADSPTNTYSTGKYGLDMTGFSHDGKQFLYTKVWNTETGKSKMYMWKTGKTSLYSVGSEFSIPANPLD